MRWSFDIWSWIPVSLLKTSGLILTTDYMNADRKNEPVPEYAPQGYDGAAFVGALGYLSYLKSLESLVLNLRQHDGPFTGTDRDIIGGMMIGPELQLQFVIFKALSETPTDFIRPLKSLTVNKLLAAPNSAIATPTVIALLRKLNHLSITTTTPFAAIPISDPLHGASFPGSIFERGVLPASLVSLELHHINIRSADILIPVARLHLPRLERLSLQRTYFSEKGALENFIVRHGATLVELKMFLCPMALSTSSGDTVVRPQRFRRWSQVWERFDRELKVLRNLVVSERLDSKGVEDASYSRYLENCYEPEAAALAEAEIVEDDGALKKFEKTVESRLRPVNVH